MVQSQKLSIALIQMRVGMFLNENLRRAAEQIQKAVCRKKDQKLDIVVLPEFFNSPYGIQYFKDFVEPIPNGKTCKMLSETAKKHNIYLVGGTIPEVANNKFYNTCTVWDRQGKYLGKYRKIHLFDMNIPGALKFKESDVLSPGNELFMFEVNKIKAGLGVCYDLRFIEMAILYRQRGCQLLIYPSAFNAVTGPMHWDLLIRSRAIDSQCYMAGVSPARNNDGGYISYGHSAVVDPWGQLTQRLGTTEDILYETLDFKKVEELRKYISSYRHKRKDVYEIIDKTLKKKCLSC